ncbi:BREX-2 system adenine-specific DNA-methyltransferase PglX [Nocardiopsis sp. NPDC049922]|uniref:BREX-2 system adenine-specific DNA-methyltransferase PglX n=1 Tax=Nocardiopsis sp. NPDC049922 TaxID=3155157 RepID=UPI003406AA9C
MSHPSLLSELHSLVFTHLDRPRGSAPMPSATWRQTEHAMVMWTLATAFVTFCEDNGLVADRSLSRADVPDPASQADPFHTIELAIDRVVQTHPVLGAAFRHDIGPWWTHRPDPDFARQLVSYWRGSDRASLREPSPPDTGSGDGEPGTAVFGRLYQDASENSRKTDALLVTPSFVIDLILEQTLEPALRESGSITEHGFRLIDPACGSGGFLLKALPLVLERIRAEKPELPLGEAVGLALTCVHGADRNPFAVMVSRFRLAVEALRLAQGAEPPTEEDWPILVVEADSLLEGRDAPEEHGLFPGLPQAPTSWPSSARTADVLGRSSYDVVVTNPPYLTPKDKQQAKGYRGAYPSASSGAFALTVPFTERAFSLARRGGHVGLLLANSFTKREFGRTLVEEFLPTVKVDQIIDTSGAYIPGHGTPTLILTGRSQPPEPESRVTVVSGLRGEPSVPADPGQGEVWVSIRERLADVPSKDQWTVSQHRLLTEYHEHPWNLAAPDAEAVFRSLNTARRLCDQVDRIGYVASTGADDLFASSPASLRRWGAEPEAIIDLVTGSEVRDWQVWSDRVAFFPRRRQAPSEVVSIQDFPGHLRRLWPYRSHLKNRLRSEGKSWYDWHQLTVSVDVSPWSIIFPWVATHPHFSLRRDPDAPLNSAPVIELPPSVTQDQVLGLLGVLNSSAACFWFKQVSNAKGNPRDGQLRSGDTWDSIYEFTATRMRDLPLPELSETDLPRELDALAHRLLELRAEVGDAESTPTRDRIDELGGQWRAALSRMVMLQEELDWRVYEAYGIVPHGVLTRVSSEAMPDGIDVGHRAFEIVLASDMAAGVEESEWFHRHATTPVTEPPDHWSTDYRRAVSHRMAAINSDSALSVLERPDFKHRWTTPSWEQVWRPAVVSWLLDRCERRELWYAREANGTERPVSRTLSELVGLLERDPGVVSAVEALEPGATPRTVLPDLLQAEHVPSAAALRYKSSGLRKHAEWTRLWESQWRGSHGLPVPPKFVSADFLRPSYWANRGKFDLPNERFVSYTPSTSPMLSPTSVLGWAGWDAYERAWVLVNIIDDHLAPPTATTESVIPLLAGLAEVLPWVDRVGAGIGPVHAPPDSSWPRRRFEGFLERLGLSEETVTTWAPPPPRRGRPPKRARS